MKRFISIPQAEFFELAKDCDVTDFILYDYLIYAYSADWPRKRYVGDKRFVWISYKKIIEDNPQLMIKNKETIGRRIKRLAESGLIELHIDRDEGNVTYFTIPEDVYEYLMTDLSTLKSTLSTQKSKPLSTQKSNNKYIKDNIYKRGNATRSANASRVDEPPLPASPNGSQDKGYKVEANASKNTDTHRNDFKRFSSKDDESIDPTPERSNTAKPDGLNRYSRFIEEFKRYRREIKKPIKTDGPIKMFVRELEKIEAEGYDLDDAMALMMEREWQTLKLDYIKGKLNKKEEEGWRWW